jgi:signal transduction histidine kinase/ActR/RegA family two-component response regulator
MKIFNVSDQNKIKTGVETPGSGRMVLNPLTLVFSGPHSHMEAAFQSNYAQTSLTHIRITLILAAVFYGGFGILDGLLFPLHKHIPWLIRYVLICPTFLLTALISYRKFFPALMQPILATVFFLSGAGIVGMILVVPSPFNDTYYAGVILTMICGYTFILIRFIWAGVAGSALLLLYEICAFGWTDISVPMLINNSFFIVSVNFAGMAASYVFEYYTRRDFYLVKLLSDEQQKVALANKLLETRVEERTAELQRTNIELEKEIAERKHSEKERLLLQDQLTRAEKMETIGKLASGVAHDLNNILSGIVSYPEMLLLEIENGHPLRQPIEIIQKSGMKAAAVVQDLLSLSRQAVTVKKVFSLSALVRDFLQSPEYVHALSVNTHVAVSVQLDEEDLNVRGSPVNLSKTLMNLVNNAMEACLVAGSVEIATCCKYLDQMLNSYERIPEGEYVVLSVSDSGTGIADEDLQKIFEPFFSKKKLGRSGTGLGMTLISSTVKEHDGFIDVRSSEGSGTVFELYFPATREALSETEAYLTISDCMGNEQVLVVDDIPEQRRIAALMLEKLGYQVHTVESGEQAVEFLKDKSVDILILDMIMDPGIDGCETYRRILMRHPGQRAVIASGYAESERIYEAQRLGAGPYIKKPYTLGKIGRAVRAELDRSAS